MNKNIIIVDLAHQGSRIVKYLLKKLPSLQSAEIYRMIRTGQIRIDSRRISSDYKLSQGEKIRLPPFLIDKIIMPNQLYDVSPSVQKAIENMTIFEDNYILIVNKPYGLAVQGGQKMLPNLDDWLYRYSAFRNLPRPLLVHRLDRTTSGVMVLAKNTRAAGQLSQQFRQSVIEKTYLAIVTAPLQPEKGTICEIIEKRKNSQHKENLSQEATTRYQVLAKNNDNAKFRCLVALWPVTGRKHQLRVHMAQKKSPVLGDTKYGFQQIGDEKHHYIYLHSRRLQLKHPEFNHNMIFEVPFAPHFLAINEKLGFEPILQKYEQNLNQKIVVHPI